MIVLVWLNHLLSIVLGASTGAAACCVQSVYNSRVRVLCGFGLKMPVLGYEMATQDLCPMYSAAEYAVPAPAQWDKHPASPYYGPVVRSPPLDARPLTYNEGLLTQHSRSPHFICKLALCDVSVIHM